MERALKAEQRAIEMRESEQHADMKPDTETLNKK